MLPDVLPEAYVAHSSPSRMRIRVPAKKGGTAYFAWLRDQLLSLPGITTVEVNPLTGSVLVVGDVAGGDIREFARVNGLFRFHSAGTAVKPLERVITGGIRQVDLSIRSYTGGQLDLSSLIFLYLAGAGIYQISIGNVTAPAWYTAFWYALGLYSNYMMGHDDVPPT